MFSHRGGPYISLRKIKEERKRIQENKLTRESIVSQEDDNITSMVESVPLNQPRIKRRRRFKRRYLQPQPRRQRKGKSKPSEPEQNLLPEGWNGAIKNIADEPVLDVEKKLLQKGKKFCPTELYPPILRMQRELNEF